MWAPRFETRWIDLLRLSPGTALRSSLMHGVAVSVLLISAVAMHWSSRLDDEARRELLTAKLELAKAEREEDDARHRLQVAKSEGLLLERAAVAGLLLADWDERRISIKQASMSRANVNAVLGELVRTRGRVFAADQFAISVQNPSEGLFSISKTDAEILLSIRGRLMFRVGSGS